MISPTLNLKQTKPHPIHFRPAASGCGQISRAHYLRDDVAVSAALGGNDRAIRELPLDDCRPVVGAQLLEEFRFGVSARDIHAHPLSGIRGLHCHAQAVAEPTT